MSGTGSTVICPGGTGQINPPSGIPTLSGRTLDNRGTLTWSAGGPTLANAALLMNNGTLHATAGSGVMSCAPTSTPGGGSLIVNFGAVDDPGGSGPTDIACPLVNLGVTPPPNALPSRRYQLNSESGEQGEGGDPGGQEEVNGGEECGQTQSPAGQTDDAQFAEWISEIVREPGNPAADEAALDGNLVTAPKPDGSPGDPNTLVIGQTQRRVQKYAEEMGLTYYKASTDFGGDERQQLELNAQVIRGAMDRQMIIVDMGPNPDPTVDTGWWYQLERALIRDRGYPTQAPGTVPADVPADDCE
jgi:hypothetical protein